MRISCFGPLAFASVLTVGVALAAGPPPWAYGFEGPPPAGAQPTPIAPAPTDQKPLSLPGNSKQFSRAQIANRFGPADWYPEEHPAMPEIVAKGKQGTVWACGLCHYPNGKGRAENAGVSGLSAEYFIKTMNDFKNGNRKSADPRKMNSNLMAAFAKNMTDEEIKAAAEYYAAIKWTPWIKVVETKMAPKAKPNNGLFIVEGEKPEMEPLGNRILETPVNGEA
ncbi:MAG: c-type cytochrome, partial [Bryobacteraceae bacterium]